MKSTTIRSIGVALIMLAASAVNVFAQSEADRLNRLQVMSQRYFMEDFEAMMRQRQQDMFNKRLSPMQKLYAGLLAKETTMWSDGASVYALYVNESNSRVFDAERIKGDGNPEKIFGKGILRQGSVMSVKGRAGVTVSLEQTSMFRMLIFREKSGAVTDVLVETQFESTGRGTQEMTDLHDIYDGLYSIGSGKYCFFGMKAEHYDLQNYERDPGVCAIMNIAQHGIKDMIAYGEGRVSHGDPSSPNYDKMPGGGGAGAIMGPMMWQIAPSDSGIHVKVFEDQRFVDHYPRLPRNDMTLTKVATPYKDVPGRWAFTSLRPLTRGLLERFPLNALTLMRGEIYARHGDSFRDADTQSYFDSQPWYSRTNKPVRLSAIEQLNAQFLKVVIAEKEAAERSARANLTYVAYEYHGMAFNPYENFVLSKNDNGEVHLKTTGSIGDRDYLVSDTVLTAANRIIEEFRMYEYDKYYTTDLQMLDGERWEFEARYGSNRIWSQGRNAEPKDPEGLRRLSRLLNDVATAAEKKLNGE